MNLYDKPVYRYSNSSQMRYFILLLFVCFGGGLFAQVTEKKNEGQSNKLKIAEPASNNQLNESVEMSPASSEEERREVDEDKIATGGFVGTSLPIPQPAQPASWKTFYMDQYKSSQANPDKRISEQKQGDLDAILNDMKRLHANTFEYNLLMYVHGNHDPSRFHYLKSAYALNPADPEIWPYMTSYYEMTGNQEEKRKFSAKIASSSLYGKVTYQWHQDLLSALDKGSVLLTNGNQDTYPLWALQSQGVRSDVMVIYLDLLHDDKYRKNVSKELGVSMDAAETSQYIKRILQQCAKPVYIASTVRKDALKGNNDLVLAGLAFRRGGDEATLLKAFWMDADKENLEGLWGAFSENQLKRNYLPALIKLYGIYTNEGNTEEAAKVKEVSLSIASKLGNRAKVEGYFSRE